MCWVLSSVTVSSVFEVGSVVVVVVGVGDVVVAAVVVLKGVVDELDGERGVDAVVEVVVVVDELVSGSGVSMSSAPTRP